MMPQPDYIAWVPGTSEVWISKGHPREKKKTAPKIIVGFVIIITRAFEVRQGNGFYPLSKWFDVFRLV